MIIVTGHAIAREGYQEAMQKLAVEHVERSRAEPGCISHEVSRDVRHSRRFVFIERWSGMAALQQHFRLDASRQFAHSMAQLSEGSPKMDIYQAEAIRLSLEPI
ncbi:putative quinol monooxygenase [Cupriavidus sp. UME77]|uniref:putative quinol monooxygenase n=1 Tax=Cupriavidus sp. UME77 TaxID=1862321 RepID=UPI001603FEA1|nr:putative quinol monooxygenase [Cupriavidus sp. UME77]MBB1633414.1 antibiotic biosynthesis monooxygenase [Cupriavidus sp. UME77]